MSKNKDKVEEKEQTKHCCCDDNCHEEEHDCCCGDDCDCGDNCDCGDDCECECEHEECSCEASELEIALDKAKKLEEALLRNQAELQNYKRRKDEEMSRMLKYSEEDIVRELLPVIDNFERAIMMDDSDLSDEVSKFLNGFKLVYTNMVNILKKFEVKEIEASGIEFDPTYHHAVLTEHDDSKPSGVILEVLQKGYMYKDRIIRPAMVKVNE